MSLFFENQKDKVVSYILADPDKQIKILEIAKATKTSKGYVSRIAHMLEKEGFVKARRISISNPEVRAAKIMLNINKLVSSGAIKKLKKLRVAGAGIYGSWANGTNSSESDVDIWVKPYAELHETKIAGVLREIRNSIDANPQLIVLNKSRVEQLKGDNPVFYYSLLYGSLQLFGERIE